MVRLAKGIKMNQDEFYSLIKDLDEKGKKKFYESSKDFFPEQKKNSKLLRKRDLLKGEIESNIKLLSDLLFIYKEKHFHILKKFESLGNLPLLTFEYIKDNIYFAVHTVNGKFEFKTEDNARNYFRNSYCGIYLGKKDGNLTVNLSHRGSELANLQESPVKLAQKYIYLWPEIVDFAKEIESTITLIGDKLVAYGKLISRIGKYRIFNRDDIILADCLWKRESDIDEIIEIHFDRDFSSNKKGKVGCVMVLGPYSVYESFDFDDGYCLDDEYDLDE